LNEINISDSVLKKIVLTLFILCSLNALNGQQVYYEDFFKGGVTGGGYNPAGFPDPFDIKVNISPGSNILKAYLFVSTLKKSNATTLNNSSFQFNGSTFQLDWNDNSSLSYEIEVVPTFVFDYSFIVFDMTSYVNPLQNIYTVIPAQDQDPSAVTGFFESYYLLVTYEDLSMLAIGAKIILNEQDCQQTQVYNMSLPANILNSIGFAFNSTNICNILWDGSWVSVNGNTLGLVGGDGLGEPQCTGVRGEFYYENGVLYGLADDTANTTTQGVDALASIESYISNSSNFDIQFDYQTFGGATNKTNSIHQLYLAYTTPCSPFTVQTPKDTTLCQGATLQLQATGGTPNANSTSGYEWQPVSS